MDDKEIAEYLLQKGFKPQNSGFRYTIDAIKYAQIYGLHNLVEKIYAEVAKINNSNKSNVERAIRHELNIANINMTNKGFIAVALIDLVK